MNVDTSTVLGVTFVLILVAIMINKPDATSAIIRNLAEGYSTAVNAFPVK